MTKFEEWMVIVREELAIGPGPYPEHKLTARSLELIKDDKAFDILLLLSRYSLEIHNFLYICYWVPEIGEVLKKELENFIFDHELIKGLKLRYNII